MITIPKNYRDELGLGKDDLIRMKKNKGRIIFEPVRTLPYTVRSYTESEVDEFSQEDKKETKILKKKGLL